MTQTVVAEQSKSSVGVDDPDTWFVLSPTGDVGPLPKTRLTQLVEAGVIPPDTLVRNAYSKLQFRAGAFIERTFAPSVSHQGDAAPVALWSDALPWCGRTGGPPAYASSTYSRNTAGWELGQHDGVMVKW